MNRLVQTREMGGEVERENGFLGPFKLSSPSPSPFLSLSLSLSLSLCSSHIRPDPGFISMMRSSAGGTEKMQYLDYENYRHINAQMALQIDQGTGCLAGIKKLHASENFVIFGQFY